MTLRTEEQRAVELDHDVVYVWEVTVVEREERMLRQGIVWAKLEGYNDVKITNCNDWA